LYEGEQEAIVADELFGQVTALLNGNRRSRGHAQPGRYRGWLEKLLYCHGCQSGMIHTYAARKQRRYRYYVCSSAQKNGRHTCGTGMLPAAQLERVVAEELQARLPELDVADPDEIPVGRLVRRVDYDGRSGELSIQLREDIV
jgi:site-specific DNA recombinase